MKKIKEINKPLLSVPIITFNEERIIEKTLSAIVNWVDEVIIIDSYSTDKTPDIIRLFDVNLIQKQWEGYSRQKNFALSKCTGDWVLVLDADEIVTEKLKNEILAVIKTSSALDGYKIKRKFYLGKRWIKYGGYYPDYQLRLFKRKLGASFTEREVHESISLNGKAGFLTYPIEHYAYNNLKEYQNSLNKYAKLASKEIKNKNFFIPFLRAIWAFIFRYFFRLGFLEGKVGFDLNRLYAEYVYNKYSLAKQKKRGKEN